MDIFERARTGESEAISQLFTELLTSGRISGIPITEFWSVIYLEVLVPALNKCPTPDKFMAYVTKALYRDLWRLRREQKRAVSIISEDYPSDRPARPGLAPAPFPLDEIARKEICDLIEHLIELLPPRYKDAILAEIWGETKGKKSTLHNARKRLKNNLQVQYDLEPADYIP
jgi:hypothetical protein